MDKKMYVGIDMGTNSVGMAVTDEEYNLYRVKGKDLWCSRLFTEADTAAVSTPDSRTFSRGEHRGFF